VLNGIQKCLCGISRARRLAYTPSHLLLGLGALVGSTLNFESGNTMNKIISHTLVSGFIMLSAAIAPLTAQAQVHSKSGELVVVEPHNLPEQAQLGGNSFFLHSDDSGSTYLYVEQQQGSRLTVFNVTDPSRIKMVSTTPLTVDGPFDFVRSLDGSAELVRFRDGKTVAVLDLRKTSKPSLHVVSVSSTQARPSNLERLVSLVLANRTTMSARPHATTRSSTSPRRPILSSSPPSSRSGIGL
jgi:hypothetical protein